MLARAVSLGLPPFEDQWANPSATGATSAQPLGKDNMHVLIFMMRETACVFEKGRIVVFTAGGLNFT